MLRYLSWGLVALAPLVLVLPLHAAVPQDKELNIKGKLTDDDPKDKFLKERLNRDCPVKTYDFAMKAGTIYRIDLMSMDFDSVLRLEDPKGKQVAINDDAPGEKTLDSRIVYKAPKDGTYKIFATCLQPKTGDFTLTAKKGTVEDLENYDPHFKLIGKPAPDISGEFTLNGKTKKLSDLKGKVVLLDFWAVWCGPCIATFPHLRDWSKDYQKDGLEILGVTTYFETSGFDKEKGTVKKVDKMSAEEEHAMLKDFATHHKLTHQLMTLTKNNWQSANGDFVVQGYPQVILIDRKGNIRMIRVGSGPETADELHDEIRKLLKEK